MMVWLSQYLARAGVCSRRHAHGLIKKGRVAVNGKLGAFSTNIENGDQVMLDGKPVSIADTKLWRFYKPKGLIVSHSDEKNRTTVFDFIQKNFKSMPRVISVGRLDYNSEGLLLLTNDGELARILERPESNLSRVYKVRIFGRFDPAVLEELKKGMRVKGINYQPIQTEILHHNIDDSSQGNDPKLIPQKNHWLQLTLSEGKNREIREILGHFNLQVDRLIRTSYGPFQLGDLKPGELLEENLKTHYHSLPGTSSLFLYLNKLYQKKRPK